MELRDLRLVLALVDAGSTTGAAKVLHLAQPSVSRALLSLEDRLDTELFAREPRGLRPTKAGETIAARAWELLEAMKALEREVCAPPETATRLRLVCECYTAYHWLPSTLARLAEDLPELDVRVKVEHTIDPRGALRDGHIDAALLTSRYEPGPGEKVRALLSDEIVFVMAKSHPLAAKEALTPKDLTEVPLFTQRAPTEEARWFTRAVFGRRRPRLNLTTVPLTEAVVDFARAGMGVAILSEWVTKPYLGRGGFVAKRLRKGPLKRKWSLAWRTEIGEAGPRLYRALKATL